MGSMVPSAVSMVPTLKLAISTISAKIGAFDTTADRNGVKVSGASA